MLASGIYIIPQGNKMEWPTHENRNYQAQSIASRRRASGVRPLGADLSFGTGTRKFASQSGSATAAVGIEGQVQASGSPRSPFGRQAPAHDVQVRPCISQGFGRMPRNKRNGVSGPMGSNSKLLICASP